MNKPAAKKQIVEPIQQIYPTGKSPKSPSSPSRKNILIFRITKIIYIHRIPSHSRGALRNVPARGGDAVDGNGATDEGA